MTTTLPIRNKTAPRGAPCTFPKFAHLFNGPQDGLIQEIDEGTQSIVMEDGSTYIRDKNDWGPTSQPDQVYFFHSQR